MNISMTIRAGARVAGVALHIGAGAYIDSLTLAKQITAAALVVPVIPTGTFFSRRVVAIAIGWRDIDQFDGFMNDGVW